MDRLTQHFTGVAFKYLSRVDATRNSNQHEIGSNAFARILGDPGHSTVVLDAVFFFFADGHDEPLKAAGTVSWYDARRHNPDRSAELRLYYPENVVTARMSEGDFCIVAARPDSSVMIIVAPAGSTMERQLRWLFNIDLVSESRFNAQDINADRQVRLIEALVLSELGIEVRQDNDHWLDRILGQFGPSFPTTAEFSRFARDSYPNELDPEQDPDLALIEWMTHEEMLFRTLERHIVQQQLDEGFRDVDHFISMSLSVQNRRKSRVGFALEHHLAAVFEANHLPFGRQVVTENKATADFLFPGHAAYHDPAYPDQGLLMLASKSTCKDRWRQVLAEAGRIPEKHLFTLEPAISRHQTDEMQAHNLRLVVPAQLRSTYAAEQQPWLMDLAEFIRLARQKATSSGRSHRKQNADSCLPTPTADNSPGSGFDFVDLFAGIGGIRRGFEQNGGRCVLTSELNAKALETYKANYQSDPEHHRYNADIREITLSQHKNATEQEVIASIQRQIPDHDVLLAGLPDQSLSATSINQVRSNVLTNGLEGQMQDSLFFDVARILAVKRPAAFVLENCKYLKQPQFVWAFQSILKTLDELGYWVADANYEGDHDPKIIDSQHFTPQHRERIVLAGFRKDLNVHQGFTLTELKKLFPEKKPTLGDILEEQVDDKYIISPELWAYLFRIGTTDQEWGFQLVDKDSVTRPLTAHYCKDNRSILVDRGFNQNLDLSHERNIANRPRRLTPRECSRLMGLDQPGESTFRLPASESAAYKLLGNSSVVPVFAAIAKLMKPRITEARQKLAGTYRHRTAAERPEPAHEHSGSGQQELQIY